VKCTTAQKLLYDYVEGRLEPDRARAVCEHLRDCEDCAREAAEWQEIHELLTTPQGPRPSEQFVNQALEAVRQRRAQSTRWAFFHSETVRNVAVSVAAAIVLMLVSDVLFGRADAFLAGHVPQPSGVSGATGEAVSGVFIRLGGILDSAFGFLVRLSDMVAQLR